MQDDHFSLFGMPARFTIDLQALESAYKRVQAQVHPDRFAAASAAERRVAMQWAARVNEAFQTLRSPLRRAAYLCERHAEPVAAESNTAMPADFLAEQLRWREQLDEARDAGDHARLATLDDEVRAERDAILARVAGAIDDERAFAKAAALVRQLMFIEKFEQEVRAARDQFAARPG